MDAIILAKKIHNNHSKEIDRYMRKWFNLGRRDQRIKYLTPKRALREQRARGFEEIDQLSLNAELPYIRSNVSRIAWPTQYKFTPTSNMGGIYKKFGLIGVSGFTGIQMPKKLLNR